MPSRWLTVTCLLGLAGVTLAQQPFAQPPTGQQPGAQVPTKQPFAQPGTGQPQTQPFQNPAPLPPLDPVNNRLDAVLINWEKAMTSMRSLVATCARTKVDKTFQTTDVFEGMAKYMKTQTGSMASLELKKKTNPQVFEKYIYSGNLLYEFAPQTKQVRVHELPKPAPGQVADDNLLALIFGMKAAQAKQRYEMTYVAPPAGDKWYQYVEIKPRSPQEDFVRARLVLLNSTFLPRQLWFEERNGSEITWDFPQMAPNVEMNVNEFAQPTIPPGWRLERMPAQNQPRVMRNQQ